MPRLHYSDDPTARADERADELRTYYEENRETLWDRCRFSRNQQLLNAGCADDFILGLQQQALDIAMHAGTIVYTNPESKAAFEAQRKRLIQAETEDKSLVYKGAGI